jgi:hypothetical protein
VAPSAVNNPSAAAYYWSYFAQPAAFTGTGATIPNAYTVYIAGAPQAGTATITNAYALYVASGNTSLLGGLTLTGATSISSITGSSAIDFSGSSGAFKTSTGRNTLNGLLVRAIGTTLTANTTIDTTTTGTVTLIPLSHATTAFTVTLPTTSGNNGLEYIFININAAVVTIQTSNTSAEYFDANSSYSSIALNQNDRMHIICYNGHWYTF